MYREHARLSCAGCLNGNAVGIVRPHCAHTYSRRISSLVTASNMARSSGMLASVRTHLSISTVDPSVPADQGPSPVMVPAPGVEPGAGHWC